MSCQQRSVNAGAEGSKAKQPTCRIQVDDRTELECRNVRITISNTKWNTRIIDLERTNFTLWNGQLSDLEQTNL